MRFLLLFLCLNACLFAQGRDLRGVVIDAASGEPLPYVFVFLESDQRHGAITNERGEYRLPLPADALAGDLLFSLMSYQPHRLALSDLAPGQEVYNVQLSTSFLELQEVVVISDIGLRAIVKATLENIPNAYGHKDYLLKGYFRRYDIEDGEYAQFVDAMLTLRDRPYGAPRERSHNLTDNAPAGGKPVKTWVDEFRLSDYTGSAPDRFQTRKASQRQLLAGYDSPFHSIRLQQLHWINNIIGLDSLEFVNRGEYREGNDTLIRIAYGYDFGGSRLNEVQIGRLRSYFSGELLINLNDGAIVRNTQGSLNEGFYYDAIYRKVDGKYYPRQITRDGGFRYDSLRRRQQFNYLLYVTDVVTDRKAIRAYRKGYRLNPDLSVAEIRTPYRPDFWARNEIIQRVPAPEALESGLSRIRSLETQFRANARRVKRDTVRREP